MMSSPGPLPTPDTTGELGPQLPEDEICNLCYHTVLGGAGLDTTVTTTILLSDPIPGIHFTMHIAQWADYLWLRLSLCRVGHFPVTVLLGYQISPSPSCTPESPSYKSQLVLIEPKSKNMSKSFMDR